MKYEWNKINNFPTLCLIGIELKKVSKLSLVSNIQMVCVFFDQSLIYYK